MSLRVRQLFAGGTAARRPRAPVRAPLKGCMRRVIVVKPPDSRFVEAVFVLRDDYFLSEGVDETELLRQAKEAARDFTCTALPPAAPRLPWLLLGFAAAIVLAALKLMAIV